MMRKREVILSFAGMLFSVVPVLCAILLYFPLWIDRGGAATLSGIAILLLALAFLPMFRYLGRKLRSPAVHTVWLLSFILFFTLSRIADEMTVISFVGFLGNSVGALFFRAAKSAKDSLGDSDEG